MSILRTNNGNFSEPIPVTGDYQVGTFYFPGWPTRKEWSPIKTHPYLGYYDQGKPEVANWHIKWAVEHGVNFFAFDWYWHMGEIKLNSALDAFLKSKYLKHIKFCIFFCNEAYFRLIPGGRCSNYVDWSVQWDIKEGEDFTHDLTKEDFLKSFEHINDHYLSHPQYLKVGNRPVIMLYWTHLIIKAFGIKETKNIFQSVRNHLRSKGHDIYLVSCTNCVHEEFLDAIGESGFDAIAAYDFPWAMGEEVVIRDGDTQRKVMRGSYDTLIPAYESIWKKMQHYAMKSQIGIIPPILTGFDNSPWGGSVVRTGNTPQKFEIMCRNVKPFIDPALKMLLVTAWNEWGEGAVLEPAKEWGFEYLDVLRRNFTDYKGRHEDYVPEDFSKYECKE